MTGRSLTAGSGMSVKRLMSSIKVREGEDRELFARWDMQSRVPGGLQIFWGPRDLIEGKWLKGLAEGTGPH